MADAFPSFLRLATACFALAACQAEPRGNGADDSNVVALVAASADDLAPAPEQGSVTSAIGPLTYRYDPAQLAPVDASVAVPPDWTVRVPGTKLIAADREKLIGKAECLYGLSGQASLCNAEQEAGLAFAMVEEPYEAISARFSEELREPIRVAGIDGLAWRIGAEGEGAEHILLPVGERTILIVRQFRTSGNPPAEAIAAVLQSLTPTNR